MENNMSDMINNMKKMIDSGNLPKNMQNIINNMSNSNNKDNSINTTNLNELLNNVPPDLINNLSSMLNSNSGNNSNNSSNSNNNSNTSGNFNIDMNTMLKMKSIFENMNNKNDPRANLLYSLKPYLRDSKKNKLDQYVNFLNMAKIAEVMKKENNELKE